MKKHVLKPLICIGLMLVVDATQAQSCKTTIDDFETNRFVTSYSVSSQGTLVQNQANPNTTGTVNSSSTCAKYTPNVGIYENAIIVAKLNMIKNANLIRNGVISLSMDVYGVTGTSGIQITLRKNNAPASGTTGRHTICQPNTSVSSSGWTNITFSSSNFSIPDNTVFADSIAELEIQIPSYGSTVYFDNVAYGAKYKSIDNFDSERNIPVSAYQGTFNQTFNNAATNLYNSSSKCATFRKATGNGNATITYPVSSGISVTNLKSGIDKFGMLLYSPSNPLMLQVSLVDTNQIPHVVHSIYQGQGSNFSDWSFVTLSLKSQPNPNTLDADVDIMVIEIDPGTASTSLYRFDDFMVFTNLPAAPVITGSSDPCVGPNPYDFSVPKILGVGYDWDLSNTGSISSGANTDSVKLVFTSNPSVRCRYTIAGGCSSAWGSKTFNSINQASSVTTTLVQPSTGTSICFNGNAMVSGTFKGSNSAKWTSSGTGNFTSGANPQVLLYYPSVDDGDLGFVDLIYTTVGGNCGTKSSTISLNVLAKPEIVSISPDITVCTTATSITVKATSNVSNKVNWYGGNTTGFNIANPVTNNTNVTYTFLTSERVVGTVVQLKAETDYAYSCGTGAKFVNITMVGSGSPACVITPVNDTDLQNQISLLPNPSADGRLVVETKEEVEAIWVTNSIGQSETHYTKEFHTQLKGLLLITIKTSNATIVKKVVVE